MPIRGMGASHASRRGPFQHVPAHVKYSVRTSISRVTAHLGDETRIDIPSPWDRTRHMAIFFRRHREQRVCHSCRVGNLFPFQRQKAAASFRLMKPAGKSRVARDHESLKLTPRHFILIDVKALDVDILLCLAVFEDVSGRWNEDRTLIG